MRKGECVSVTWLILHKKKWIFVALLFGGNEGLMNIKGIIPWFSSTAEVNLRVANLLHAKWISEARLVNI